MPTQARRCFLSIKWHQCQ